MILRSNGGLLLISQTGHARICGAMARAWGNDHFEPVRPFEPVVIAAAEHDNGWAEWEREPRFNPETRRPYTYIDIPVDQHLEIYRRGIRRAIERDPYAGLLVSLHGSLLYSRFRAGQPGADEFLSEQAETRERLVSSLERDPQLAPFCREPALMANRDLLFAWDALSLFLCHGRAWMDRVEVPDGRSERRLPIRVEGDDTGWRLEPYPFGDAPLTVGVDALRSSSAEFDDPAAMRRELKRAERVRMEFRLRA